MLACHLGRKPPAALFLAIFLCFVICSASQAQTTTAVRQASNPLISYTSILLQWDYLGTLGPVNHYLTLNIQPSIPFHLNNNMDMLALSDLPVNSQMKMIYANAPGMQFGDYQQFLFFSRAKSGSTYFGIGPVFSFPTATDPALASGKWGIGPALQAAYFGDKISYGVIGYYLCSYAGDPSKPDISRTYWNPWITFTIDQANNWGMQTEPYYDFIASQAQVPLEVYYNHFVIFNGNPVKFTFDGLYWPIAPSYFPNWSLRFNVTLLYPK
jgi:hypothetical protein